MSVQRHGRKYKCLGFGEHEVGGCLELLRMEVPNQKHIVTRDGVEVLKPATTRTIVIFQTLSSSSSGETHV